MEKKDIKNNIKKIYVEVTDKSLITIECYFDLVCEILNPKKHF